MCQAQEDSVAHGAGVGEMGSGLLLPAQADMVHDEGRDLVLKVHRVGCGEGSCRAADGGRKTT